MKDYLSSFDPQSARCDRRPDGDRCSGKVVSRVRQEGSDPGRRLQHGSHCACLSYGQAGSFRCAVQPQAEARGSRRRSATLYVASIHICGSSPRPFRPATHRLSATSRDAPLGAGRDRVRSCSSGKANGSIRSPPTTRPPTTTASAGVSTPECGVCPARLWKDNPRQARATDGP